jgi:glyoxylase-like metal-dependent hydrolase (beta-lactamase superfamily II)
MIAHPFSGHTVGSVVFVPDDTFCFTGDAFF